MTSEFFGAKRGTLYTAVLAATALLLSACGSDDNNNDAVQDTPDIDTSTLLVSKPAIPTGLGYEQYVAEPSVEYPLPAVDNLALNEGDGRFFRDENPILTVLSSINKIWQGTTEQWQTTAGNYTDDANGYKAGDGPNPHAAANGQPSDYVEAGTEIVDAASWAANIQYVIDVTAARTEDQALFAFLDDIRSKTYSTIDGFGPLTEDYAANSGAYASFEPILLTDVTENNRYAQPNNDSYSTYGGQTDSTLGDMVQLAKRFRDSHASTSGPKYIFGTPRPWRMTDTGNIDFKGVESLTCIDGASETREEKEYRIDSYTSSVNVLPGLFCGRRAHSSSKETELLYTATTENRRKDNGYPSGHANAGILASLAYAYALPERFAEHVARGSDLGENRIIAGMHSPVDVIGGRMQALMVATYALNTQPAEAAAARQQALEYFGGKAAAAGMSLYDYAHQTVTDTGSSKNADGTLNVNVFNNNRFDDHAAIKADYLARMTYGLPQNGTLGLAAIVPKGAEALLKTRQPYLSDEQRRAVLATTEVESGYPLLDDSNGWGRINLIAAGDGYGAFNGDVNVYMDAGKGGFNAQDEWRNNISGAGKLTKNGTGQLTLTGNNHYSGGTVIEGGVLAAASATAFGSGDVYINGGAALVNADGAVAVANLTLENTATLAINMDTDSTQVAASGTAYVAGAALELTFASTPASGTTFTLIQADNMGGEFASVYAGEVAITLEYTDTSIVATVE